MMIVNEHRIRERLNEVVANDSEMLSTMRMNMKMFLITLRQVKKSLW